MRILSGAEVTGFRAEGGLVSQVRAPPGEPRRLRSLAIRPIAGNPGLGGGPAASPQAPGSGVRNAA